MIRKILGCQCLLSCIGLIFGLPFVNADSGNILAAEGPEKIALNQAVIVTGSNEPSYIHYGAQDLANYLKEITGVEPPVTTALDSHPPLLIVIGKTAEQAAPGLLAGADLGEEGYRIKLTMQDDQHRVLICGRDPHGTNYGIAALMRMIRAEGKSAYVEGPLDIRGKPRFAVRGIHLNGWAFNYPYAYRPWMEQDWERFIDMLWSQGGNLLFMLPMMEIMPVPLSREDEAYLQEVRRIIDYAHKKRGISVWLMTSANRVAVSDCGQPDPKLRPFWVNTCQVDMNPADPQQFEKIMRAFEVLYRTVDNADGIAMIDCDPGGWPQSPLSEQVKIFKGARALLDRYNLQGKQAQLTDWMWLGWGRHKFMDSAHTVVAQYDWTEKNPDASDVAFMEKTIRAFHAGLPEPWGLIAGFSAYLRSAQEERALTKTIFLPYGAIEYEPSFPMTNVGFDSVRNSFESVSQYPGTRGVMGNNMTPLLQLPRTFFFLSAAWDDAYRKRSPREALLELAGLLYPQHQELIANCFGALEQTDPEKISAVLEPLEELVEQGQLGRAGVMGREIFPDPTQVARDLVFQLKIRATRQRLLQALFSKADRGEGEKLTEDYLDALLAWDKHTGWEKLIDIGIWRAPIYASDKQFGEALSNLKRVIGGGSPVTSYAAVSSFFAPMTQRLTQKYGEDAVMIGCIEPLKLAVIQAP